MGEGVEVRVGGWRWCGWNDHYGSDKSMVQQDKRHLLRNKESSRKLWSSDCYLGCETGAEEPR